MMQQDHPMMTDTVIECGKCFNRRLEMVGMKRWKGEHRAQRDTVPETTEYRVQSTLFEIPRAIPALR